MSAYSERFSDFYRKGFYVRASVDHILDWNIGLDYEGNKALKLRGNFMPQKVDSTKFVSVQQYTKDSGQTIIFSLLDDSFCEQFYHFCEDMVDVTKSCRTTKEGYSVAIFNYGKWKKMFQNNEKEFLSITEIMGLMAEIVFLKDEMIPAYGETVGVRSWTGQERTRKDFTVNDTWYEIKAISKGKNTVKISSLVQLDSNNVGYLVIYPMERVSGAVKTFNLNQLVKEVYDEILDAASREIFFEKVSIQGFAYHEYYNDYKFVIGKADKYLVSEQFPKLVKGNVNPAIVAAEYSLDINSIEVFKVES